MYIQVFAADTLFLKKSFQCILFGTDMMIDYISRIYNYSRHNHQRQSQKRNWSMKYKTEIPPPLSFRKKATKHKKQRNKNFQNKKKNLKKRNQNEKKKKKIPSKNYSQFRLCQL